MTSSLITAKDNLISVAQQFYSKLDEWHNLSHGQRVVSLALVINKQEQADPLFVEIGAWLHQYHDNLDELSTLLKSCNLEQEVSTRLYKIAEYCRPNKISKDLPLEVQIVFDADALELMGPYGIVREVLCNYKCRNQDWQTAVRNAKAVQELFYSKICTKTARDLCCSAQESAGRFWVELESWERLLQ